VLRGHEEDSASEGEIERSIIDSTTNRSHHHRHMHAEADKDKAAAAAAGEGAAAAAASADTEMKTDEQKPQDGSAAAAGGSAAAPAWRSIRRAGPTAGGATSAAHTRPSESDPNYTVITEYLVKLEGQSYLHTEWHTEQSMKDKFGPNARITLRIGTFRSNQAEMEATNLDRYGGEPFDPRYMEVDRIIASNFVEVEEEPEEKAAREKANEEAYNAWAKQQNERATQVQALAATDQAAAMQLQMRYMMQPLPQPKPTPPPKPRRVEMFLVKWTGLSYSQCTWETAEDIDDEPKIAQYRRFNKQPSRGERQLPPDYSQVSARPHRTMRTGGYIRAKG
jgi:hypothetical protein